MNSFSEWLGSGSGIAVCCLLGVIVTVCIIWYIHWRTALRTWEGDEANKLLGLGAPDWFVAPLLKASQGDKPGAIRALKTFASNITSAAGLAELDAGYITKAKADPTRWARWKQVIADIDAGASFDTVKGELQQAIVASPLSGLTPAPTPLGVLKSDVSTSLANFAAGMKSIAVNPASAPIVTALHAAGLDHLIETVASSIQAHSALSAAPTDPAPPAGGDPTPSGTPNTTTIQTHADNSVSVTPAPK